MCPLCWAVTEKCLLCDLCLASAGCTSRGLDNEPEEETFLFCPENTVAGLEEHHFVSLYVAAMPSPGLRLPLACTVAAAPWLTS